MSAGKLIVGLLTGVAAGALLGIAFAPDKGCQTRKKIRSKGNDYAGELKGKFDDFYKNISEKHENLLQDVKDLASSKGLK